jgi:DNA-3-methyladenine glycosylase
LIWTKVKKRIHLQAKVIRFNMNILDEAFYQRENVVQIGKELLGKYLFTQINGEKAGGMIVETEAYSHVNDRACHSHLQRRTQRTEIMYHSGGVAYVYLCYGIHHLFNIITNAQDKADAVLIRAIEPTQNVEIMQKRRGIHKVVPQLTAGPGAMSQALGITTAHYGLPLTTEELIWVEDRCIPMSAEKIIASPRIGVAYAGEDALLPWRFRMKDNIWTSKAK